MKSLPLLTAVSMIGRRVMSGLLLAGAVLGLASSAWAQGGGVTGVYEAGRVGYSTDRVEVQGIIPYTRTYAFDLTSPSDFVAGTPRTVTFNVAVLDKPTTVDDATALSYLKLDPAAPVFTQPNEKKTIVVTYAIPPEAVPGAYSMKITTVGFQNTGNGLLDYGHQINGKILVSDVNYAPPIVVIGNPADASVISVTGFPVDVPFSFTATSTGTAETTAAAITKLSALLDGGSVDLATTTGLGTTSASATGTLRIETPGVHSLKVQATNLGGDAIAENQFAVVVVTGVVANGVGQPPTVTIASPTVNSVYTYRAGSAPTEVPFTFTATSTAAVGGIQTLTAKVDGMEGIFSLTSGGIGLSSMSGKIDLSYSAGGVHTVSVETKDANGTAVALANFTVNVVAPTPTIAISQPLSGSTLAIPSGATTVDVPYVFTTTSNNGFVVDAVSASLDGTVFIPATTGLATGSATSTGTLLGVPVGKHTLVVKGGSAGIEVREITTFTVTSSRTPPTVVINTPAPWASYTMNGAALSIPLTFTGKSTTANVVISQLGAAALNGPALTVTSTTLGQTVANGAATMTVSAVGTYAISVTAVDEAGSASAVSTFSVVGSSSPRLSGSIFFDVDRDGNFDSEDYDLAGISVTLYNASNGVVGRTVTDGSGAYLFADLTAGTYRVVPTVYAGLKFSTVTERTVEVTGGGVSVDRIGAGLDFAAIRPMAANGFTIGYWKNNLEKAIAGKSSGAQVSSTTLALYTANIGAFALPPFNSISREVAVTTMDYSGSTPVLLLSKQLIASEYNYQNGAYLGGNRNLTMCFLWWGEYVMANPSKYSSTDILWAKDWFDAYNNTHGGAVKGPR